MKKTVANINHIKREFLGKSYLYDDNTIVKHIVLNARWSVLATLLFISLHVIYL